MNKKRSITQVLRNGHIRVNVPTVLFILFTPIIAWYITPYITSQQHKGIGLLIGLFVGMVLSWLWWSYQIPIWRIWAFQNTDTKDWPELKKLAIAVKLTWPDGSIFEKTEIRTKKQKLKIREINEAIAHLEPNQGYLEDLKVPESLTFYYKRSKILYSILIGLIWFALGCYLLNTEGWYLSIVVFGLVIYKFNLAGLKNINNRNPQLVIGNDGIDLKSNELRFVTWSQIEDLTVDTVKGILKLSIRKDKKAIDSKVPLYNLDVEDYKEFLRIILVYLRRGIEKEQRTRSMLDERKLFKNH